MNFDLSDDQVAFARLARDFSEAELAPYAAEWDQSAHFSVDTIRRAADLGFLSLYTPEHLGGMGLTRLDSSIILEELAQGCTATTAYITIHNMASWMIASFAQPTIAEHWVPRLASGELLASYCLTEPNAGSDAASLRTRAERDGSDYLISGSKIFISGAGSTEVLVVMARTGGPGPKGISAFLVPADSAGISYGRKEDKMGWNCQPTRLVNFDRVRVPASHLLGEEGQGFRIAMMGLDGGRINIATCSLGTAQAALTRARDYLLERQQFNQPLAEFQALQFRLADMVTELVAARQMVRLAAYRLDQNHPDKTTYCAMAKRFATDVGFKVCDDALQLFGGNGYLKEYPMERYVRDTRVHRILEGTNEIMRVIIARRALLKDHADLL